MENEKIKILLAEDDASIRVMLTRMLEAVGYTVLGAADGVEALQCFEQHADTVALAILDSLMPKLNGPDALTSMKAIRPDLRAIVLRGDGNAADQVRAILDQETLFLQKPFEADTLLRLIRGALDSRRLSEEAMTVAAE